MEEEEKMEEEGACCGWSRPCRGGDPNCLVDGRDEREASRLSS
jgi:hypothetical protein